MRLFVRREARVPFALEGLALRARVPCLVHRLRNLEGRIGPSDRLPRRRDFLLAKSLAVRLRGSGARRRALADDRLAADERRASGLAPRRVDRRGDRARVVPVDRRDHVPAVGREAHGRVVAEPALHFAVNGNPVVVVEHDELREAEDARERACLVGNAFHEAAVTREGVRVMADDLVARAVELGRQQPLGEREADRVGEALAERPRGRLHAGRVAGFGMAGRARMQLAEAAQLLHRQVVAGEVQQRVLQHRAVAVGEHEAVAVGPRGIGRVVAQVASPEHFRDFRHAHRHARMAGIGRLHGVHRERADRVDDVGVGGFGELGGGAGRCCHLGEKPTKMLYGARIMRLYLRTFSQRYFSLG